VLACEAEWDMLLKLWPIHCAERLVQPCVVTRRSGLAGGAITRVTGSSRTTGFCASWLESFSGVDVRQLLQEQAG